jgi:hypothetical protein
LICFHNRPQVEEKKREIGVEVLVPQPEDQENLVTSAIFGKSGIEAGFVSSENRGKILKASKALISADN